MIQFVYRAIVLVVFVVVMAAFMHFIRPYSDAIADRLGGWVFVILAPAVAVSIYQGIEGRKPGLLRSLWRKRN